MRLPPLGIRAAAGIYAAAGVTLVCNDWWLKGAGLLPGWLTGKLSDLAGLIVAIVTAALVLGHRRTRTSLAACISIASVFALVKLSPSAAQLFLAALSSAGLKWRLVPDPTDLVALGVVPLAWTTARTLAERMQRVGLGRLVLRASAIPAAMACLASGEPDRFSASGYVYNDSSKTLFVEISSVPWVACDQGEPSETDWLERSDFQSIGLFQIAPREVLPLDGSGDGPGLCRCLYRVTSEGRSVVVRAPTKHVQLEQRPEPEDIHKARPQLVFVRPGGELLPGSRLEELAIPVTAPENSCAQEPSPMTFSARVTNLTEARIVAIQPVAGECWELELVRVAPSVTGAGGAAGESSMPEGAAGVAGMGGAGPDADNPSNKSERLDVCAPRELLPFDVGDLVMLTLQTLDNYGRTTHRLDIYERAGARGFRLELGAPSFSAVRDVHPDMSCGPGRDSERRPWLPLQVTVDLGLGIGLTPSGLDAMSPGERREVTLANGTRATLYLGRAHQFLSENTCGWTGSGPLEDWIEVVESWSL